jgi:hypothetical protein
MFKVASVESSLSLPRLDFEIPLATKVACFAYSIHIAGLLESQDEPSYTKLASLVSENTDGARRVKADPWSVQTILGLNHQFYC